VVVIPLRSFASMCHALNPVDFTIDFSIVCTLMSDVRVMRVSSRFRVAGWNEMISPHTAQGKDIQEHRYCLGSEGCRREDVFS